MVNCKDGEIEFRGACVNIADRFKQLMTDVPTSIFWKWVESWKDPIALINETENWNVATKKQTIRDIEKLIEEQNLHIEKKLRYELNRNRELRDLFES